MAKAHFSETADKLAVKGNNLYVTQIFNKIVPALVELFLVIRAA